MPSSRL